MFYAYWLAQETTYLTHRKKPKKQHYDHFYLSKLINQNYQNLCKCRKKFNTKALYKQVQLIKGALTWDLF